MKRGIKFSIIALVALLMLCMAALLVACNNDNDNTQSKHRHEESDWIIDVEPTCGEVGHKHTECVTCHAHHLEEDIPATDQHTLKDEWIEDSAATCTKKAHHHKKCSVCGYHMVEEDYGELEPHDLGEWIIDGNYTCGDTVTRHKDCANCEYSIVDDNYYVDHVLGEWIEDSEATCTVKAHHHKECANCDYTLEEDYGDLEPHKLGEWIEDSEATCIKQAHHHKECAHCEYTFEEDYGEILPHELDPTTKKCKVCQRNDFLMGDTLYFGEYPQTKVEDNGITATLAQMSGDRPVKGNSGDWTDYRYYIGQGGNDYFGGTPTKEEYMWYIDLEYNGARYRGVYFTSYRPWSTTVRSSTKNSYQVNNGYNINTLYWFKWEPIEWRVLEKTYGEAFLMSNVILDSQQYYHSADGSTRTIDGKTVNENNYKESDIRAWLNGTFYKQAFDESEQAIIKETLVNNSASTTASSSNKYACENTNDKVFLLSYKDVLNSNYGFDSNSSNEYDTAKQLKTTGYAQSQGVHASTSGSDIGGGDWWLRSPRDITGGFGALYVFSSGYANNTHSTSDTSCGVVPAIKITL